MPAGSLPDVVEAAKLAIPPPARRSGTAGPARGSVAPDAVDDSSERLSLLDFVTKAASHLPTDYAASETYVDDAQARLDGALRSAAALDPAAFLEALKTRPRTNVTCSLEDHAEMIQGFNK